VELETDKKWCRLLDSVRKFVTPQEECQIRVLAAGDGPTIGIVDLHRFVARPMVVYGISTWTMIRSTLDNEHPVSKHPPKVREGSCGV
jgi:hypothetical protein